jgi:hypothetical protein
VSSALSLEILGIWNSLKVVVVVVDAMSLSYLLFLR